MSGKNLAIGALVVMALLLGGLVASSLQPRPAYGQGGVYSTYLAGTAMIRDDNAQFVVLDTAVRRLVFYSFSISNNSFAPVDGRRLDQDFQRQGP